MHLSDEDVAVALDPEAAADRVSAIRAHASGCSSCTVLIEAAERQEVETADILHLLDHPAPRLNFEAVMAEAATRQGLPVAGARRLAIVRGDEPREAEHVQGSAARTFRRASILIALGAMAAAAAVPHSPLRRFIASLRAGAPGPALQPVAVAPVAVPDAIDQTAGAGHGVAILPTGSGTVVFTSLPPGAVVRLHPSDGGRLRVAGAAEGSVYDVGQNVITVTPPSTAVNQSAATVYDVRIPEASALPTVTVRIGAAVVFRRQDRKVETNAVLQSDGTYVITER